MNQTKIEEGEYIRLNHGVIFKADIDSVYFFNDKENAKQVKNHDKDIINLIEEGDYVNSERVEALKGGIRDSQICDEDDVVYTSYNSEFDEWCGYHKDEIKTIVTKEQFANAEYRVEG